MKIEIWKDIKGYEGRYQISNFGRVKSLEKHLQNSHRICTLKERYLKPRDNGFGYSIVALYDSNSNRKDYKVHRLVAQAFIPNPNNLPQVNHKDFDRKNNVVNNLEWVSRIENIRYTRDFGNIDGWIKIGKELGNKYGGNKKAMQTLAKKLSKKVYQYDLNGNFIREFASGMEAQRITGVHNVYISGCCLGKKVSAGGFLWKRA